MNKRYIVLLASVLLLGNTVLGQDRDGYEAPPTPKAPKNIVGYSYPGDKEYRKPAMERLGHIFSGSLRTGYSSFLQDAIDFGWEGAFSVMLDFGYTHYFMPYGAIQPPYYLGVTTGLSLGYSSSALRGQIKYDYRTTDYMGNPMHYYISALNARELDGQFLMEIPIMGTFFVRGYNLNAGLKLGVPLYSHYSMSMPKDLSIDVNYPTWIPNNGSEETLIHNHVVTGCPPKDNSALKGKWNGSKLYLMLSMDMGYIWRMPLGSFGVNAYVDYAVWSLFKQSSLYAEGGVNDPKKHWLDIGVVGKPMESGSDVPFLPEVKVNPLSHRFVRNAGYLSVGIKLTYYLGIDEYKKYKQHQDGGQLEGSSLF
jgi:hypothetical protein